MSSSLLNLNQSPEELNSIYGEQDYYWYHRSPEFHRDLLAPLGAIVTQIGNSCLDVGCGEAQLADHVGCRYAGFDGSQAAINRAKQQRPTVEIYCDRLEAPALTGQFDVVAFCAVLEVLVKAEYRSSLLLSYQTRYSPKYFVVCDLLRLDTTSIANTYERVLYETYTVDLPSLQEEKKHRKIEVFKC